MKLDEITGQDQKLDEILPALAMGAAKVGMGAAKLGAQAIGGAAKLGAQAVGQVAKTAGSMVKGAGQAVGQAASGLAGGGMDPAQAAQAAKERTEQKKQVQDSIKAKEQELLALRKQLAELG